MNNNQSNYLTKIKSPSEFITSSQIIKNSGGKIVFTNGCFDLIHIGHIRYLKAAKQLADYLFIGINDDHSIKKLKGSKRPINELAIRLEQLASLQMVDFITYFSEDTPINLITAITPNYLVKGGDWKIEDIVGYNHVNLNGGTVLALPFVENNSSTNLITKILAIYGK